MMLAREPVGEIEQHTREEAGLGDAEQEADDGEARRVEDEGHRAGEDAPSNHYACDPETRADLFHDHVARHLEDKVAEKERSQRETEIGSAKMQVAAHRETGKTDVDAVDVGQDVGENSERQQTPIDLPHRRFFDSRFHGASLGLCFAELYVRVSAGMTGNGWCTCSA